RLVPRARGGEALVAVDEELHAHHLAVPCGRQTRPLIGAPHAAHRRLDVLADPHQAAIARILLLDDVKSPDAHDVSLPLPEAAGGGDSEELSGVREIGVGAHNQAWIP